VLSEDELAQLRGLTSLPGLSWSGSSRSSRQLRRSPGRSAAGQRAGRAYLARCRRVRSSTYPPMDDPRSTIERAERSFPRAISEVGRIDTSRA